MAKKFLGNHIIITGLFLFVCSVVSGQPGISFDLKKPQKFENRKLASEKTDEKKYTIPRSFIQNTISHYNYFFNANTRLNEVVERSKASFKDNYSELLPFYNYTLETSAGFKSDLDSVIYKANAGILLHDLRTNWVDNFYMLMGKAYYLRKDFDSAYLTFQYLNFAFSPKEKDGYDKIIGSNSNEGGSAFSISTNEKQGIVKKVFFRPPSRNEALVWQIRTYLAKNETAEAAGLIQTLKYDPLFPDRLKNDLHEMQALWFYQQNIYDSAAFYLDLALGNAANRQEQARWEYLIAQLYELAGNRDLAEKYFDRAGNRTLDPVMEVYARLNSIRQNRDDEKSIQQAVEALAKMARREKYVLYRDVIYYSLAKIELERNSVDAAKTNLLKSIKYSENNPGQKSASFLALAEISFDTKKYVDAKRYYDSVNTSSLAPKDLALFESRRDALTKIDLNQGIITRQDSLRRIAAMPEAAREAYIRKMVRQMRKQQGLQEEPSAANDINFALQTKPQDIFNTGNKNEWYFANAGLKAKGFTEFRSKWGTRPNVDNWRRADAITQAVNRAPLTQTGQSNTQQPQQEISYDAFLANLPLTPEKIKLSGDSTDAALFNLGKAYQDGLEDYSSAINAYEELLAKNDTTSMKEQTLFNLYYCYGKTGNVAKQEEIKRKLAAGFPNGKLIGIVNNPVPSQQPDSVGKAYVTKIYNDIYNLFIEGNFEEAIAKKRSADSSYGQNFWTPQLLYIEAVYHVKQHNDSLAIDALGKINQQFPNTALAAKALNLIDVLARRKEIETYLTNLKIERPKEDSVAWIDDSETIKDIKTTTVTVAPTQTVTPVTPAENKPSVKSDSAKVTPVIRQPETVSMVYNNNPAAPHLVMIVLDKVDPVYVSEARNAFNRYNKEKYYNKPIEISNLPLTDDIKLVVESKFENATEALDYIEKVKKVAATEIVPWLTGGKYYFVMITESNLEILKSTKDINTYNKFLQAAYPGRF